MSTYKVHSWYQLFPLGTLSNGSPVTTPSIDLKRGDIDALAWKAASFGGAPDIAVEYAVCMTADEVGISNWISLTNLNTGDAGAIAANKTNVDAVAPLPARFIKFRFTNNDATDVTGLEVQMRVTGA
jgi:hypothetical protein